MGAIVDIVSEPRGEEKEEGEGRLSGGFAGRDARRQEAKKSQVRWLTAPAGFIIMLRIKIGRE